MSHQSQTATREHPIVFSGEMARAILAGRKSMTRQLVKMDGVATVVGRNASGEIDPDEPREIPEWQIERLIERCPYGQPGDRLWCKEVWAIEDESKLKLADHEGGKNPDWIYYRDSVHENTGLRWRSPRFMPRWASRITLEITGVRVERLQDIIESDALAEGIERSERTGRFMPGACDYPTWAFRELWDSINGKKAPWESNPWVFVVEFKRIEK